MGRGSTTIPRRPSGKLLDVTAHRTALSVLLLSMILVPVGGLALSSSGCKRATLEEAPDGAVSCNAGAHVFCAPDAPVGCAVAPGETDPRLSQIAPGTYAVGCVANFVAPQRDVGGDCVVDAICRCNEPSSGDGAVDPDAAPPAPHWTCFP
jgi:hypothetical protein